jgi:hypothetical protein
MDGDKLLTLSDVRTRAKGQIADSYLQFASLVKGGSVVVAATVLLDIFRFLPAELRLERLIYLVVTVLYSLLPVMTYRRGVILATPPLKFGDYFWPLMMGFSEIAAFTALGADLFNQDYRRGEHDFRLYWFASIAANAFAAVILVSTRWGVATRDRYEVVLHPLVEEYRGWMDADRRGAAAILLTMLAMLVWLSVDSTPTLHVPVIGVLDAAMAVVVAIAVISVAICGQAVRQYNVIIKRSDALNG